jgi:TatD-related deoxyribonuclease
MHLYNNLRFEALKQFKKEGGTHVFLVSLLTTCYDFPVRSGKDFGQIFDFHIDMVGKANEIVKAFSILSVHPAEITILGGKVGFQKAAEIMKKALDVAGKYVAEGKAVALKSGRPHYSVPEEVWDLSNRVLRHAFEVAKDVNCPVQLHTESFTLDGMKEIIKIAEKVGINTEKVIKHFAPPEVSKFEEIGMFPSIIASGKNVVTAAEQGSRFMVETDYIDDKKRPGSVLGPKTVPKKIKELLNAGFKEELVYKICKENPEKIYDIEIIE